MSHQPPAPGTPDPQAAGAIVRIEDRAAAVAAVARLIDAAARTVLIHCRQLDRGLFDDPAVTDALRRFATRPGDKQVRILLQDASGLAAAHAALLGLAQRLPSAFALRETVDPADREYPSAFVVNDRHGYYFRPLEQRLQGEAEMDNRARTRLLADGFEPMWERSRPCSEFRALGL